MGNYGKKCEKKRKKERSKERNKRRYMYKRRKKKKKEEKVKRGQFVGVCVAWFAPLASRSIAAQALRLCSDMLRMRCVAFIAIALCVYMSSLLIVEYRRFKWRCALCFLLLPCCFPSRYAVRALYFACIALLLALVYSYKG